LKIENIIQANVLASSKLIRLWLPLIATVLVVFANWYVFTVVPNEQVMGAVQRIFYFHVAAAMASYLMIGILFISSCLYLAGKKIEYDVIGQAAGNVALLLCSAVLVSGMIWGHSAWNTWWRWEPRLVSFLVLWLVLLGFNLLRNFVVPGAMQRSVSAVVGILAAVNVPVVIFSIKLLNHSEQLHPEVVATQGLQDPRFLNGLLIATAAVFVLSLLLLMLKVVNAALRKDVERLKIILSGY